MGTPELGGCSLVFSLRRIQSIGYKLQAEVFTLTLNDPKTTLPKLRETDSCHFLVNRGEADNVHHYSDYGSRNVRVRGLGCSWYSIL